MHNNRIVLDRVSVERLEQIEQERNQTYADPNFVAWMQELNVSGSYEDRTYILNAREAMRDWDATRLNLNRIVV